MNNGYYLVSELEDVLKSGYFDSPIGYDNVYWFVFEIIKLENRMGLCIKNTKKDNKMAEEDDEDYTNFKICRFRGNENKIEEDKGH